MLDPRWGKPFTVIDTETTGVGPDDRIVEVGAVTFVVTDYGRCRIVDARDIIVERSPTIVVLSEFQTLVNPGCSLPPEITEMTGISQDVISHAPSFSDVRRTIEAILSDSTDPLIGFNWPFDRRILAGELSRGPRSVVLNLDTEALDPMVVARRFATYMKSKSLSSLAEATGFKYSAHRAVSDCLAISHVFACLMAGSGLLSHQVKDVLSILPAWRRAQEDDFEAWIARKEGKPPRFVQCNRCGAWLVYRFKRDHACISHQSWPVGEAFATREEVDAYEKEMRRAKTS